MSARSPRSARFPRSPRSACPALDDRIDRLRQIAHADDRLEGVLLYGSWTLGEADAHSDIEAYLYIREDRLDDFDGPAFLEQLAPLSLAYTNMYGVLAVVFDDLMRGEFHLTAAGTGIDEVPSWAGMVHLPRPEQAVLLDRTGRLTGAAKELAEFRPPEPVGAGQRLVDELTNWTLNGVQQGMRPGGLTTGQDMGEHRLPAASRPAGRFRHPGRLVVAPQQLQLCRLLRGSTAHWLTPSRALEQDLSAADRHRYAATTAVAREADMRAAARCSWRWSRDLGEEAAQRWGVRLPRALHDRISGLLSGLG